MDHLHFNLGPWTFYIQTQNHFFGKFTHIFKPGHAGRSARNPRRSRQETRKPEPTPKCPHKSSKQKHHVPMDSNGQSSHQQLFKVLGGSGGLVSVIRSADGKTLSGSGKCFINLNEAGHPSNEGSPPVWRQCRLLLWYGR